MGKKGNGIFARVTGDMSPVGKTWFYLVFAMVCFCGLYIGLWASCNLMSHPIDVPYITADSYHDQQDELANAAKTMLGEDGRLTMLLLGADFREGETAARSDTLMVAFVDLETPSISLLSIPRDTYVDISGNGQTKINHAFAYGGQSLTRKTVENFLNIEVDRYLMVDFNGFAEMIDALGGVDMEVEAKMYKPEEGIDLQPGMQHLDGKNALAYCRWRGDAQADIGRVGRQQKFLSAVANQLSSLGTIAKLPRMIGVINDNVETDFSNSELLSLFNTFKNGNNFDVYTDMVQGEGKYINGVSYWIPFEGQVPALVEKMKMTPAQRAAAAAPAQTGTGE